VNGWCYQIEHKLDYNIVDCTHHWPIACTLQSHKAFNDNLCKIVTKNTIIYKHDNLIVTKVL